jgi:RHS repeat-associated protein
LTELTSDGTSADASVADFSAVAVVTPEDEIRVTIADGAGRTVASGWLEQAGTAITWGTVQHDAVVTVSGFGDVLETKNYDALDHITRSRTDGAGRTLESEDAENEVSTFEYDGNSNLLASRDPNAVGLDCEFDERNRDVECTDTQGDVTARTYDKNNNLLTATDAKSNDTVCKYGPRDRRFECTDRISSQTDWRFDQNSNLLSLLDGDNQTGGDATLYTYDSRNLKVSEAFPGHNPASSVGDADYDQCLYAFDAARRLSLKTDQLGDTVTPNWDMANRLVSRDYRLEVNSPSGTIADTDEFEYDDASRLVQADSGRYNNTVEMTYDNASRRTGEDLSVNYGTARTYTVDMVYDAANRLTQITYPDGSVVERDYTDRNQLDDVDYTPSGGAAAAVADFVYDVGMREIQRTHGNGIVTDREYDRDDNYVTKIDVNKGMTAYPGLTFTYGAGGYDANKNVLAETTGAPMAGYSWTTSGGATGPYDDEDRLTYWARTAGATQTMEWPQTSGQGLSLVGDWDTVKLNGAAQSRTHDAVHQVTAVGAGGLTHDAKGNITQDNSKSPAHNYTWDFDNRMSFADVDGTAGDEIEYAYDALGRRVSKTFPVGMTTQTNVYVCRTQPLDESRYAGQVLAEYAANAASANPGCKFIYGQYIDEPLMMVKVEISKEEEEEEERFVAIDALTTVEIKYYYHTNRLYSVTAMTNQAAAVVERYAYAAYGALTILAPNGTTVRTASAINNPYTHTGRRHDEETGLYYYRARYYDAELGRFLGRDPIGYGGSKWNLYEFVGNRPSMLLDPSGNSAPDREAEFARTPGCSINISVSYTAVCKFSKSTNGATWEEEIACPNQMPGKCCRDRAWGIFNHWLVESARLKRTTVTTRRCVQTTCSPCLASITAKPSISPGDAALGVGAAVLAAFCVSQSAIETTSTTVEWVDPVRPRGAVGTCFCFESGSPDNPGWGNHYKYGSCATQAACAAKCKSKGYAYGVCSFR